MGWDVNVHVHVTLIMFRGGVGWGGVGCDVNVMFRGGVGC